MTDLAEALRRAALARTLDDSDDVLRRCADRLGVSIHDARKLAAAMLDALTKTETSPKH